ncbi:TPA: glycosyltransferase [Klebsiella quasipneumoniae]|uniref:glycosyltransferase n=1 Tax=Klebsiella quasipneumoniae TaxID=1463165 RepID=UPI0032F039EF
MMKDKKPLVTVYITTYNRVDYLERAVESVINQDYINLEIIICDDFSNDSTKEYCEKIITQDKRVKYFRNSSNKGACYSRNIAINNAKGVFITGLDDDDEFSLDRISFFVSKWDDKYSFLCANFTVIDEIGNKKIFYKDRTDKVFGYKDLLFDNKASNQIFTRTERLRKIDGFDITVKRLQDWDTWLRLSYEFGSFIRYGVSKYIMHDHNPKHGIRVSNNQKYLDALVSFIERNKRLYDANEVNKMYFNISRAGKKQKLSSVLYWSIKDRKIKYLLQYVYHIYLKLIIRK